MAAPPRSHPDAAPVAPPRGQAPPRGHAALPGTVYLVGAGPGASDLLTVRGARLLATADVVVYDSLVDPELHHALTMRTIDVGKRSGQHGRSQAEINDLLVAEAMAGHAVVRLKGGDPFVLGRGSEEALTLAAAGIPFEVVPGVSSCLAAPLLAGIPLTHRGVADGFTVISGHLRYDACPAIPPYDAGRTLVVLMGIASLPQWLPRLAEQGFPGDLPVAFITWAGRPQQTVVVTTVERALVDAERHGVVSPTVIILGAVVAVRDALLRPLP